MTGLMHHHRAYKAAHCPSWHHDCRADTCHTLKVYCEYLCLRPLLTSDAAGRAMLSLRTRVESLLLTLAARIKSELLPLKPISPSSRGVPLFFEDTNFMMCAVQ